MLSFQDVEDRVTTMSKFKSDISINLQSLIPTVQNKEVGLATSKGNARRLIQNGLSSYLEKINIPIGFFRKCNHQNQIGLLQQFHVEHSKQDVILRLFKDDIRFIGSHKYNCFDDIDIIKAVNPLNLGGNKNIVVRDFVQSEGHTILKLTTKEPLKIANNPRPFFPGVQVVNSEIGESSVRVQFFIWEQVCTNGMVIARAMFPEYRMIHIGSKKHDLLQEGIVNSLGKLESFANAFEGELHLADLQSGKALLEKIKLNSAIPVGVQEKIHSYLPKYIAGKSEASSLDVISSLTEAAQSVTWGQRLELERIAGDYLAA